jgi:dihydrofolate reductase
MKLAIIAVVARNGAIGRNNALLVHLSEDLKHFKRTTLGCPIIMGRKTFESIGRPLPGRRNIVVTRNGQWHAPGVETAASLDAALALLAGVPKAFVVGGGELYAQALPMADELVLTEIERDFDGDTFFPAWDRSRFTETSRERHHAAPPNDFDYAFVTYQRLS